MSSQAHLWLRLAAIALLAAAASWPRDRAPEGSTAHELQAHATVAPRASAALRRAKAAPAPRSKVAVAALADTRATN